MGTLISAIIVVIAIAFGLLMTYTVQQTACQDCPLKHKCEELMKKGEPNICEENELLEQWYNRTDLI